MLKPAKPIDEEARLKALEEYAILDTEAEAEYDDLTRLASDLCGTPIALISLIDADRVWCKSKVGLEVGQGARELSFCAHAILGRDLFVVSDATKDDRFADNPHVTGEPGLRFYAGSPLVGPEGHAFGSICVIDRVPRDLLPHQASALRTLGRQVVSQMRLRRTGRSLVLAEQFSRSTLDALGPSIATVDSRGTILTVNRAWRQANGGRGFFAGRGPGSNYLAECDARLAPPAPGCRPLSEDLSRMTRGEVASTFLERPGAAEHEGRWLKLVASRFVDRSDVMLVVIHEDVTEHRRVAALERERQSLGEAVRSLEQVLGVVGHELRTPLAGLRVMTEFVSDPAARDTPEWPTYLASIGTEVVRMSDTVDALLEAALLNSGRSRWNWSRFDIGPICRDVADTARRMVAADRVAVCWEVGPSVPPVLGDAGAIHRLLSNLVSNARKHTADGRIRIRATVEPEGGTAWLRLSVSDTGAGVAPELVDRLGEAFALNSGVMGRLDVGGTGLGLAICKGIAAAHGGRLRIESSAGRGTTVTATLRGDLPGPSDAPPVYGGLSVTLDPPPQWSAA